MSNRIPGTAPFNPSGLFRPLVANDRLVAAAVSLVVFCVYLALAHGGMGKYLTLIGAERVLAGQIPYRDFWTMYAPGQFYLLAGLFALFGSHVLVNVIAGTLFAGATVGLSYLLVVRMTASPVYGLLSAALFAGAFLNTGYFGAIQTYMPMIFFLLAGLNLFERYLTNGGNGPLVGAGLMMGCAALFKHDVGAYGAVAVIAGLLVYRLVSGEGTRWLQALGAPLKFGLAAAAPVLPVVVYFAFAAGYDAFWDTIWFPLTIFPDVRQEPYPSLIPPGFDYPTMVLLAQSWVRYITFALPFLVWLASLPLTAINLSRRHAKSAALGVTFAVAFLFHYVAAHVQVNTHFISMTLYAVCVGALLLREFVSDRPRPDRGRTVLTGLAAAVAVGWIVLLIAKPVFLRLNSNRPALVSLDLPKASSARMPRDKAQTLNALGEFVRRHVPRNQTFYAGLRRHDLIIVSAPLLYFLFDRLPPVRYHELHSGVADTAPVQAEIIRDLKAKDVKFLILWDPFPDELLDRLKRRKRRKQPQIGATDLDRFIRANYVNTRRFGRYSVWLRK